MAAGSRAMRFEHSANKRAVVSNMDAYTSPRDARLFRLGSIGQMVRWIIAGHGKDYVRYAPWSDDCAALQVPKDVRLIISIFLVQSFCDECQSRWIRSSVILVESVRSFLDDCVAEAHPALALSLDDADWPNGRVNPHNVIPVHRHFAVAF